MKNYFLIIALLFNSLILFSQEISIKIVEIKSLDTNTITNSSFSLKKINTKGLTNKKKNNYFNYNLDFDILSNENVIDITKSTELVTPTWIIKQKFKEGSQNKSRIEILLNVYLLLRILKMLSFAISRLLLGEFRNSIKIYYH